jgi:PIN domain nuclease of toxin-antitoxin system
MTYIDPLANRATRRAQLLAAYDFTCQCEACRGPSKPKELQKSDNRREKLATWSRTPVINRLTPERWLAGQEVEAISYNTGKISKTMSSKLFLGAMTELMGALQSERLEILRAIHMEVADALVRTHAIFGDRQVIQQALKTAIEVWSVDSTHSSIARRRIETYRKWSHDVTVAPHWNKKKL